MYNMQKLFIRHFTENDPADFRMPYRVFGRFERELMFQRYMRLEHVEKPPFVYPKIVNLLD